MEIEQSKTVKPKNKEDKLPEIKNPIKTLGILVQVAALVGIKVNSFPFTGCYSVLKNGQIGIKTNVTIERACYELAWELSHVFIHSDVRNVLESPRAKEYNKQADKAADMIIKILNVG